ncbi:MAG: acyl--CoA ligase [Magnetococcus sp. THC-1_WYH]
MTHEFWTMPFTGENLLERLQCHALENGGRPALVSAEGQTLDYGTLWSSVVGIAVGLMGRGVKVGQRVFLVMDGSLASVLVYLGVMRLGGVAVLMDPGLTMAQWSGRLRDLSPEMVVAPREILEAIAHLPGEKRVPLELSDQTVDRLVGDGVGETPPPFPTHEAVILILATTGTTGMAKYVTLTLGNISASVHHINNTMGLMSSDIEVITLPLFHSFGLGRLRCGLSAGCRIHLLPGRFRPERLLKEVQRCGASVLAQVPAGIRLLLALGQRVVPWLQSVRLVEIGSASMKVEEKERLMILMPQARLWHHYGLTEASRSLFLEYHQAQAMGCLNALGQPPVGVEVALRSESGEVVTRGVEEGELLVRGPHVTPGYVVSPRDPMIPQGQGQGWFATGDWVQRDSLGYYHYVGRVDDCINLGGFKVYPSEVELALTAFPGVVDVAVCARDAGKGMQIIALMQCDGLRPFDEKELRDWLQTRLEPYKHPQIYRLVDALPRTPSGKLLRRELGDLA